MLFYAGVRRAVIDEGLRDAVRRESHKCAPQSVSNKNRGEAL